MRPLFLRPTETSVTSTVPVPVAELFEVLADPTNLPQWLPACRAVKTAAPFRKGARMSVEFPGHWTEFEVVDFAPPHNLGWVERGCRKGWKTFIRLGFAGASTTITLREVRTPTGFKGWLLGKRHPKRRDTRFVFEMAVQNLRKLVTR